MARAQSIRFPDVLRQRVAERAAAEHRTFSGQVLQLLERALAAGDMPSDDELRAQPVREVRR